MSKDDDENAHVAEFLGYYCNSQNIHTYAVLIDGPWGAGKTHFIKKWLKEKNHQHLYVSLNGVTSTAQIEKQFFTQMHPLLASKGMRLLGQVLKGVAKTTVKIDLYSKSDDASLTMQVPDVDLASYFSTPENRLLIFDDLERCEMPIAQVLGYINYFVEHDGFKVILIANESEVTNKKAFQMPLSGGEENCAGSIAIGRVLDAALGVNEDYARIKEKLVGYTLQVRSPAALALTEFIASLADAQVREFLSARHHIILGVFQANEQNNLRVLQRGLWDFERMVRQLDTRYRSSDQAMEALLKACLALSMALRLDKLKPVEVPQLFTSTFAPTRSAAVTDFAGRYPDIDLDILGLDGSLWVDILCRGLTDANSINAGMAKSIFFSKMSEQPPWLRLLHFRELEDRELEDALTSLDGQMKNLSLDRAGEILHVFGMLIWLSRNGIIEEDPESVVVKGKTYIEDVAKAGRLESLAAPEDDLRESYGGFGFVDQESPYFVELREWLSAKRIQAYETQLPEQASALLQDLKRDPELFLRRVNRTNSSDNTFAGRPILHLIEPSDFVKVILGLQYTGRLTALKALKYRYENDPLSRQLAPEKKWLEQVRDALMGMQGRGSNARLRQLVQWYIFPALQ